MEKLIEILENLHEGIDYETCELLSTTAFSTPSIS